MSDTRLTILGIGLIFAGFIVAGVLGGGFDGATLQQEEFGDCYEYFEDKDPVQVDCEVQLKNKNILTGIIIGLIVAGVASLILGVKGKWDQKVKPQDMVGPGGENDSEEKD